MTKIADVIKYEGDNTTFVWKYPKEDFNSLTQLIVHENQEAIFFMDGQALDTFGPGRYTLETENIPELGKRIRQTGFKNAFHCEVYFINKSVQMSIKWGTDSKVRFLDPELGVPLEIGACGELNLEVENSRKLLVKLVGTMKGIAWDDVNGGFTKSIQASFRPLISTAVKTHLSTCIKEQKINILEIDQHLEMLSNVLRKNINPGFEEYGLNIPEFYVTTVVLPEEDPNFRRIRDLHTVSLQTKTVEAEATVKTAQAEAEAAITAAQRQVELERQTTQTEVARRQAERDVLKAQAEAQAIRLAGLAEAEVMQAKGYSQRDVIQADVQKAYAEGIGNLGANAGEGGGASGGMINDFVGLGMGLAAAGAVGGQMSEMFKGLSQSTVSSQGVSTVKCVKCGNALPSNAKFCLNCGEKIIDLCETIVCPQCGKTVANGKFCIECGYQFISECPKCGNKVPVGSKFCLECGEKL